MAEKKKKTTKKKIVKKKITKKVVTKKPPKSDPAPIDPVVQDENKEIENQLNQDNSNDGSATVVQPDAPALVSESELIPKTDPDSDTVETIKKNRLKKKTTKKTPGKKSDKQPIEIDPAMKSLLKPDALKTIFVYGNSRLVADGSLWGMEADECDQVSDAVVALVDKYFPEIENWGVEATAIFVLGMYAIPRIMQIKADRSKPAPQMVESEPKPKEPAPIKPAPIEADPKADDRLKEFQ